MATIERLRAEPPADTGSVPYEPISIREVTAETRIGGEDVSLTYREPADKTDITDPLPLLIAHGWGGPESAYGPLGEEVAKLGKPSVTYGEGRSLGTVGDLNPLNLFRVAQLSSKAAWAAMRFVHEEFGHDQSDGYGHSLGGQTIVNVALHKPGRMRAVILDGSCGLDDHTLLEMIGRTGQFAAKELLPALSRLAVSHGPRTGLHALHYVARHPTRTLAEGLNAGSTNLHDRISQLASRGVGISAIQSLGDVYFPFNDVEGDSRHLFEGHFHKRQDPAANHLAPQLDPQGTAEVIMHALHLQRPNGEAGFEPAVVAA